jgi:hypothetical protein
MRAFATFLLLILLAAGCVSKGGDARHAGLSYTFHPADVVHASAQALDTNAVRSAIDLTFNAELHLKLNDAGVRRFEGFNQAYEGKVFDLLVNGEVLASGLTAHPRGPTAEMVWYVGSMEKATRFADSLSAK